MIRRVSRIKRRMKFEALKDYEQDISIRLQTEEYGDVDDSKLCWLKRGII